MKNYTQAPLPFQGQKRRFVKEFREKLKHYPADGLYVDLFGGSGLLSHTIKSIYPMATVIYNDFDNYTSRLENIDNTNRLISDLRIIVKSVSYKDRVPNKVRSEIIKRLENEKGFVDYVTLSANLLFSGKYARNHEEFIKHTFYNRLVLKEYNSNGYLEGCIVVTEDYKRLFDKYKGNNAIFVLDPPYLSTDVSSYTDNYWTLTDYLDVLDCLQENKYFYFTSNKSSIIELCNWVESRTTYVNPFSQSSITTVAGNVNFGSSYNDIMVYKHEINKEKESSKNTD